MAHYPTLQDRIAMETGQTPPQQPPPGQPQPPQPSPAAPQQPPGPGQAPTPPGPAQPTATGPAPNALLTLPVDEFQRLMAKARQLDEFEAEKARALEKKEQDRLRALAEKGEADKALEQQRTSYEDRLNQERQRANALQSALFNKERTAVLNDALFGVDFISADAGRQARKLLEDELETTTDAAGTVLVRQRGTGRPAAEVVKEQVASPAFAHFLKPTNTGGAGASGTHRPGTPPADDPAARIEAQLRASIRRQVGDSIGLRGEYMQSSKN
jgi:hypothetical protein